MQNDHLADAILFLRSALSCFAEGYPVSRYDIEGAIREIEAEIEFRSVASPLVSHPSQNSEAK
jgi:hypothetical protein